MLRILYMLYLWLFVVPVFVVLTILTALTVIVGCLLGGERILSLIHSSLVKLPKLDEEYEMKMADLKNLLVDKLLVLTNGKVSQGVKDYMNTEIIAKGVKFSRKALEELDYNSIQVSKWTADADKNELIKQVRCV